MKATKRFLAGLLAATMVCGTAMSVSAATTENAITDGTSGSIVGTGTVEGYANKDVLRVVLPTIKPDFIVDPQGLLSSETGRLGKVTNKEIKTVSYDDSGIAAKEGLVYFSQAGQVEVTDAKGNKKSVAGTIYTPQLELVVENKSSYDVTITPTCTFTPGYIKVNATNAVVEDSEVPLVNTEGSKKNIDFKLLNANKDAVAAASNVGGVDACYEMVYASNAYTYKLNESKYKLAVEGVPATDNTEEVAPTITNNKYKIYLQGQCFPERGDWSDVLAKSNAKAGTGQTVVKSSVSVTWTIAKTETPVSP